MASASCHVQGSVLMGRKKWRDFEHKKNKTCQTYNLHTDSRMWWDIHCTVTTARHFMSTFTNCNCNEWYFLVWLPGRLISDCNKTFQFGKSVAQNEHWIQVKVLGNKVNLYWSTVSSTVTFTYFNIIFTVHISSFFNEGFHCVHMAPISCPV